MKIASEIMLMILMNLMMLGILWLQSQLRRTQRKLKVIQSALQTLAEGASARCKDKNKEIQTNQKEPKQ